MKRLMILGGSRYVIPVIKTAHDLGIYVITCDYLPDNAAHKYSDKYCNMSVIDKEGVLRAAEEHQIDGIISFACDPGVVTAAYVAEEMKLPFQCSYESASILQDKGRFRDFLAANDFNTPWAKSYSDETEALKDIELISFPVIVKPVDSAGSKGVTKVSDRADLKGAIEEAKKRSHSGRFIIEEFLLFEGYHSSADPFSVDGKLVFNTYSDQLFDNKAENPYAPSLIIWPSSMDDAYQQELEVETQRLFDLLGMKNGIYNIESCVADGKPYLMEVSPRGGGCKIAEIQEMAYGTRLIENEVRSAVGMPVIEMNENKLRTYWCEMVVHTEGDKKGIFEGIDIDAEIECSFIRNIDIGVNIGDVISPFTGANASIGDVFLEFSSREELDDIMSHSDEWLKIRLE